MTSINWVCLSCGESQAINNPKEYRCEQCGVIEDEPIIDVSPSDEWREIEPCVYQRDFTPQELAKLAKRPNELIKAALPDEEGE